MFIFGGHPLGAPQRYKNENFEPDYEKMTLLAFPINVDPDHPALLNYQFRV